MTTRAAVLAMSLFAFAPCAGARSGHPPVALPFRSEPRAAVTSGEHKLAWQLRPRGPVGRDATVLPGAVARPAEAWRVGDLLHVYVSVTGSAAAMTSLGALGLTTEHIDDRRGVIQGWLSASALRDATALDAVRAIRPVRRGVLRAGSVTSEGDGAARANLARATGYDGSGVLVGAISDGIDGITQSITTGDVPAGTGVPAGAGCSAACDTRLSTCNEGTALLEIVHDLAPGAALAFAGGIVSHGDFINAIGCLQQAGARVILDDIGFFDEPFFEDGDIAEAVRGAVAAGVSYHSAAGNEGNNSHYQGAFLATAGSGYHDFLGGPVDNLADLAVAPRDTVDCILQWDDPWGASSNDYDLELWDLTVPTSPQLITASTNVQSGTQDPFEEVTLQNLSRTASAHWGVAINKITGADRDLGLFCLVNNQPDVFQMQYSTSRGSVFGHPAVPEAVAVGALDATGNCGYVGAGTIEPFSSQGPATIAFPTPASRAKPDLMGFDGVSTSLAAPFDVFCGTSAATPHVAAVAALLLSKNPSLTPAEIQTTLTSTAVDLPPSGTDDATGAGRVDALAAIAAVVSAGTTTTLSSSSTTSTTTTAVTGSSTTTTVPITGCGLGLSAAECQIGRLVTGPLCAAPINPRLGSVLSTRLRQVQAALDAAVATSRARSRHARLVRADAILQQLAQRIARATRNGHLDATCDQTIAPALTTLRQTIVGLE